MIQTLVALFNFFLSGFFVMMLWDEKIILKPIWFIVIGCAVLVMHIILRYVLQENKPKVNRLIVVVLSIYAVLSVSSFAYYNWTFDKFISAAFFMKFSLVVLLLITLYLNFVVFRAEQSYKKKRGNQRIKEEPKETIFTKLKKKKESEDEIYIVLGAKMDEED